MADYTAGAGLTRVDTDWQGLTKYSTNPGTATNMGSEYDSTGTAGYIPQLWAGKLIERWYNASVIAAITSTDYEGEIKNLGDNIVIRSEPPIAITDYKIGMPLVYEVPGSASVNLAIDSAKTWAFAIDDVDAHQSDLKLMSVFADAASESLKVSVDSAVLTAMVDTAKATENMDNAAGAISGNLVLGDGDVDNGGVDIYNGTLPASTDRLEAEPVEYILRLGQALDEQNAPESGRWVVLPAWMIALLKNSILREANTMGDSQSPLRNGKVGTIDRFTVYSSNQLPTKTEATSGGVNTVIYAGVASACAFASQIVKNETLANPDSFGELMRGLQVFGYQTVKPEGLVQGSIRKGTLLVGLS